MKDEDDRLGVRFHSGATGAELADEHQRTTGAIKARLVRLGHRSASNPSGPQGNYELRPAVCRNSMVR